ncbi:MAG TPA: DinB family protein [Longimicrobiales bacterium]|nr:DinB family protein [Longimicrobiales bacterium]
MTHPLRTRPGPDELPEYYLGYVDRLGPVDAVLPALRDQAHELVALVGGLDEARQRHRYAEGKWSVREVVGHLVDTERVCQMRALWFARGDGQPLPGFDENRWADTSRAGDLPMGAILEEHAAVRESTLLLFRNLDLDALRRRGEANGQTFQAGAMAWFFLGHEAHHIAILRERYGL